VIRPPKNIRRGLLRIYVLLAVPWLCGFGYLAYSSYHASLRWQDLAKTWQQKMEQAQSDPTAMAVENAMRRAVGETSETMLNGAIEEQDKSQRTLHFALAALPMIPLGLPILYIAFLWVVAGFRRSS